MQVPVFLGGVLVWIVTYALVMKLTGWDAMASADTAEALRVRRYGGAVAGVSTGLYFGVLWTRACGGPVLNFLYMAAIYMLMPKQVWALGGALPEHEITNFTGPKGGNYDIAFDLHVLTVALPGLFVFGAILTYWNKNLSPEREEEFAKKHLPKSWLDDRTSDSETTALMECASCATEVRAGTIECENCGYNPKRSLVATGLAYFVGGIALLWFGGGLSLFVIFAFGDVGGAFLVLPLAGLALWIYGLWMGIGGWRASVRRDVDGYTLPVFW